MRHVRLPHRALDFCPYRRAQEDVDQIRVELGAASLLDGAHRFAEAAGVAVATSVSDRVEAVGDRDDPRRQRNSLPLQSSRISCAVPSLVVCRDPLPEIRIESLQRCEDLGAALSVRHHGAALLRSELGRLVENIGQRPVKLADVVEERDTLDAA